jgi:methylmalonyl-CoA mutase
MLNIQEFENCTEEKWKSKILTDLKGKSLDSLKWQSEIGEIDPILFNYSITQEELPDNFPYKRGYNTQQNSWRIAQSFIITDAQSGNTELLKALRLGVNLLRIRISGQIDLNTLFSEVMLEIISTEIICSASLYTSTLESFQQLIKERNYNPGSVDYVILQDSITDFFQTTTPLTVFTKSTYLISAGLYANAGATIDHQIAFALAHGHEYLTNLVNQGVTPSELPELIRFELAVGTSYFLEIAKIRAFRVLWATILEEYGVPKELAKTKLHITTSGFYYSNLDVHTNLLRSTTSAMSALIAGCDSLEILPYDHFLPEANRAGDGQRLAINIQLILQEEAYLSQVADAGGGSYYIESVTDQLIDKSWHFFKDIEQLGGLLEVFKSGQLTEWLNSDLLMRKEQFSANQLVQIGVNKFPSPKEKNSETQITNPSHTGTISSFRLAQFKA